MTYGQRNGGNGRNGRGVGHRNRNRVISETTASIAGMRVAIVRKPIKNMYLRIKPPNADIVISAPQRMSQNAIERFVTERKPWIERAQCSMRQARDVQIDAQLNAQRAQNGNIGDTALPPTRPLSYGRTRPSAGATQHRIAIACVACQMGPDRWPYADAYHVASDEFALGIVHAEDRTYPT